MDNLSQNYPPYTKQKAPFPRKIVFLIFLFILLAAGGIAGVNYLLQDKKSEQIVSPAVSPTAMSTPSDTPTPTVATSPSPSPTAGKPTPTIAVTKVTPTKAAGVGATRSGITVSILNGSGVAGAASKISSTLKDAGYTIGTVGNADTFDYTNVSIEVKKSKGTVLLSQLKQDLSSYTIGSSSATLAESSAADAVVIVGK